MAFWRGLLLGLPLGALALRPVVVAALLTGRTCCLLCWVVQYFPRPVAAPLLALLRATVRRERYWSTRRPGGLHERIWQGMRP